MCNLKILTEKCGANTPPGTKAKLRLIPTEEVTGYPQTLIQTTPASTTPGADVILDEAWVMAAGAGKGYWREYDILIDSGAVNIDSAGEKGALSFSSSLAFHLVGTKAERLSFAQNVANCCLYAMIQTREDDDNLLVFGKKDDAAKISEIKITTGAKAGDKPGGAYVLQDSSGKVPFLYPVSKGVDIVPNT